MEKKNLKSALQQLEAITEELNQNDVDVELGLQKFKEGVSLIKWCRNQMQRVENEFIQLKQELEDKQKEKPAEDDNVEI